MSTEPKTKLSILTTVYFSGKEAISVVEQAKEIGARERWSFNRLVFEALQEYVRRHGEGNVTFTLDGLGVTWSRAIPVERGLLTRQILEKYPLGELETFLGGAVKEVTVLRNLILERKKGTESSEDRLKKYLKDTGATPLKAHL